MSDKPNAEIVVLRQTERRVPEFHRYAARLRARGHVVAPGDLLTVYQIARTVPEGPVLVTDSTEFVFSA